MIYIASRDVAFYKFNRGLEQGFTEQKIWIHLAKAVDWLLPALILFIYSFSIEKDTETL